MRGKGCGCPSRDCGYTGRRTSFQTAGCYPGKEPEIVGQRLLRGGIASRGMSRLGWLGQSGPVECMSSAVTSLPESLEGPCLNLPHGSQDHRDNRQEQRHSQRGIPGQTARGKGPPTRHMHAVPSTLPPYTPTYSFISFSPQLKCHLFKEAFFNHPISTNQKIKTLKKQINPLCDWRLLALLL